MEKARTNGLLKACLIFSLILFFPLKSFSDSYKIRKVDYDLTGTTRVYALQTKVPVDKKKVFESEDDLILYIKDFKKRLENTRAFDLVNVDFTLEKDGTSASPDDASENKDSELKNKGLSKEEGASSENTSSEDETTSLSETETRDDLYFVDLKVQTRDSLHILGAPYPKYDSNNGFSFKLKMKDTNFFGSLETMSSDINFNVETKSDDTIAYKFGFEIGFDIPFKMGIFNSTWLNTHKISYTIGEDTPEWNLSTGLELELPFNNLSVKMKFVQSFIRDLEYEDADVNGTTVHYGDGTYFVEDGTISVPLVLQDITDWGKIYYTPYFEGKFNWDKDGISEENEDLMSPVLTLGQTISTSRINWKENFRNGLNVSLTQSFSYNLQKLNFIPGISGELKGYKAFKYAGLCCDIYAFACLNGNKGFGDRLRGIRDEQYYSKNYDNGDHAKLKACESPAAIVMNFDLPVRIFVAHWDEIPFIEKHNKIKKLAKYFNMEFQLSPFVDVALSRNRATGRDFYYKDGFYAGGIEAIVYPLKWKGIQVRGSLGIDLGQKMPGLKNHLNQEWRDAKWNEISIGIGLHY